CLYCAETIGNAHHSRKYHKTCLKEKEKKRVLRYYYKNKRWLLKKGKEYGLKNKQKLKEYRKKYGENNKEKIKNHKQNWRRENREETRKYRKKWRKEIFTRDDYTCQKESCSFCKNKRGAEIHPHHIKHLSNFPELAFDIDNGIAYCKGYHLKSGLHVKNKRKDGVLFQ
ncbi:hypothetical protein LCGC14_2171940, partial [marine sediment metagenome]